MNVVIKEPGQPARVVPVDGRRIDDEVEKIIGGYTGRAFRYRDNIMAWCDDDGLRKKLPINFDRPNDGAPIYGTVVVTALTRGGRHPDTETTGLDNDQVSEVLELLAAIGVES